MVGRRAEGATFAQAGTQARAVAVRLAAAYPEERKAASAELRMTTTASTAEAIAVVGFVMAVPLLILLVACANLANQLLARGIQRGRDIAVRLSLGASRGRVVRELLLEAALLAGAGSLAGLALARVMTDVIGTRILVIPFRIPVDLRVFGFTTVVALLTALAFGLVPALRATRMDLAQAVKDAGKAGGYRRSRLTNPPGEAVSTVDSPKCTVWVRPGSSEKDTSPSPDAKCTRCKVAGARRFHSTSIVI